MWSIFKEGYKPQRVTRLIYAIITFLYVVTLLGLNDRVGLFLAIGQFVNCLLLFLLSLKYGVGGTTKVDIVVFISAMVTLIIWRTTNDSALGLYMSIATDFIGTSLSIVKAYKYPFTESYKFCASDTVAGFFNLLSLRSYTFSDIAFPGYIFLINFVMTLIIIVRRKIVRNT